MDDILHMADGDVAEALVGRLLHLVGVGVVVEHLLHLPQVHGGGDDIQKVALRPQHPAEFLDGQRGKAVEQQVDALLRHRQVVGGGHGELHTLLPLGGQPQDELGDIRTRHPGRFPGIAQGAVDGGGVVPLAAAAVQHRRRVAGQGDGKLT